MKSIFGLFRRKQNESSLNQVFDRVARIKGFSLDKMQAARIRCIGTGGVGSWIALLSSKLGIGNIDLIDPDNVEPSNTTKAPFSIKDIGVPKVVVLKKLIREQSPLGVKIRTAHELFHQTEFNDAPSIYIATPDNDRARYEVSDIARLQKVPALFAGTSPDGEMGYVFLQLPGKACFRCFMPKGQSGAMTCAPANAPRFAIIAGTLVDAAWKVIAGIEINWNRALYDFRGRVDFRTIIPGETCVCREERSSSYVQ